MTSFELTAVITLYFVLTMLTPGGQQPEPTPDRWRHSVAPRDLIKGDPDRTSCPRKTAWAAASGRRDPLSKRVRSSVIVNS